MIRIRAASAATVAALVCAVAGAASADAKTIDSKIVLAGTGAGGGTVSTTGKVKSKSAKCLSDRKIEFEIIVNGTKSRLPADISSMNGYAGSTGPAAEFPDEVTLKMDPKDVGRDRCSGDRTTMTFRRRPPTAKRETIPGSFQYNNLSYAGSRIGATGYIQSAKRCLEGRRVETFPFDDGVSGRPLAHDISSRNGYWGAFAKSDSQGVGLRLTSEPLGGGDRCGGSVYTYDPDPNPRRR